MGKLGIVWYFVFLMTPNHYGCQGLLRCRGLADCRKYWSIGGQNPCNGWCLFVSFAYAGILDLSTFGRIKMLNCKTCKVNIEWFHCWGSCHGMTFVMCICAAAGETMKVLGFPKQDWLWLVLSLKKPTTFISFQEKYILLINLHATWVLLINIEARSFACSVVAILPSFMYRIPAFYREE